MVTVPTVFRLMLVSTAASTFTFSLLTDVCKIPGSGTGVPGSTVTIRDINNGKRFT